MERFKLITTNTGSSAVAFICLGNSAVRNFPFRMTSSEFQRTPFRAPVITELIVAETHFSNERGADWRLDASLGVFSLTPGL